MSERLSSLCPAESEAVGNPFAPERSPPATAFHWHCRCMARFCPKNSRSEQLSSRFGPNLIKAWPPDPFSGY